jgi:beta-xylosidase
MRRIAVLSGLLVAAAAPIHCILPASAREPSETGVYRNPILADGSPADPHVLRVDGLYYLYPTTHGRGYDAWVSKDLVHWEPKGRVFDNRRGAWAPDVFHHRRGDGKFYLYYTDDDPDVDDGKRIGVAVADGPLGPFVDKRPLVKGSIDAHLFQDDDGRLYLYYVKIDGGFEIKVQPMADPLTPQGEPTTLITPTEPWERASGEVTEGPFILKRERVYYLMYSGSGADSPHYAIGYATSDSPLGPFTKYAKNPIVKQREGLYGPGHHCVVEGPDAKLWMVYHQKWNGGVNWGRFLALDPLWFDDEDVIHARATRGSAESAPTAKRPETASRD